MIHKCFKVEMLRAVSEKSSWVRVVKFQSLFSIVCSVGDGFLLLTMVVRASRSQTSDLAFGNATSLESCGRYFETVKSGCTILHFC